jgi:hypothetical protein
LFQATRDLVAGQLAERPQAQRGVGSARNACHFWEKADFLKTLASRQ